MIHLETDRLVLRNFTVSDWRHLRGMIIQYQSSPMAAYDHPWPTSPDEVQKIASWFADGDSYLAVCLKDSDRFIGFVGLNREQEDTFNLGYVFNEAYHGQGYAYEACRVAIDHAFDSWKAVKIIAGTGAVNLPSQRLLERLGFKKVSESMVSLRTGPDGTPIKFLGYNYEVAMEQKKTYQDHSITTNDILLQVREYPYPGESIVFLHFGGANLMMWQRAVPIFQGRYRLLLVDLRGHGKSSSPETGYDKETMAVDVLGVLDHFGIAQAHVIGSSLGAEVGLALAANHHDRVISLTCDGALSSEYGPYSTWEGSEQEFQEHVNSMLEKMEARPEAVYPSLEALLEKSQEMMGRTWNEDIEAVERYGTIQLNDGSWMKAFRKHSKLDYFHYYFKYRLEDDYRRIHCPVLLLPSEDVYANEGEQAAMEGLCRLLQKGEIVRVPGWDHPYGWLIEPQGVCEAILDFLRKQELSS